MVKHQQRVQILPHGPIISDILCFRFDADSEHNFGKLGSHLGVCGEVKGSAQENQNERQSKSIDEVWGEIAEKQKIKRNDPELIRTELETRFKCGTGNVMDNGNF